MSGFPEQTTPSDEEILRRFYSLGYFAGQEWDKVKTFVLGSAPVQEAVEQFRANYELPAGNAVDDMLVSNLMMPRCGCPDLVRPQEAGQCKWPMRDVTYAHRITGLNPLASEVEQECVRTALANWNAVCGINLTLIDDMGAANIYANIGSTGAGVLAYSYLPCGATRTTRLSQVYNRATNWSKPLLIQVLTHEIGHAIGLDHGPNGALMQPTASGSIQKPQSWDIQQVVSRYGQPTPKPTPPADPEVPVPPSGGAVINIGSAIAAGQYRLVPISQADAWDMSP